MKIIERSKRLSLIVLIHVILFISVSLRGYFTPILDNIPGCTQGSSTLGDYDNDGDLDVLLMGAYDETHWSASIYSNDGSGNFSNIGAYFQEFYQGSAAWGDIDADGDLDLLLSGAAMISGVWNTYTILYVNHGNSGFIQMNTNIVGVYMGASVWGDFDNDGFSDVLITGYSFSHGKVSRLYRNNGNGTFSEMASNLIGITNGSCSIRDFNNDGYVDIILTGETDSGVITSIYSNDGLWNFVDMNAELIAVSNGSIDCGDFDNDGYQDLLLTGNAELENISRIYRNNLGNGFADINAGIVGVSQGSASWGDFDNDSDLDILLTGNTGSEIITKVYSNNGGVFNEFSSNLQGVHHSTTSWGDIDEDGYIDIMITGESSNGYITSLYRNAGNPGFTTIDYGFTNVYGGYQGISWIDYDNDDDLDVMITGFTEVTSVAKLYRNDGDGVFVDIQAGFPGVFGSSIDWGDFDRDGDLDLLFAGMGPNVSAVYRNDGNDNFTDIDAGLPVFNFPRVAWIDFDNDSDLDIIISGSDSTGRFTALFQNDNGIFLRIETSLPGVHGGSVDWGDFDNDGDLDLLLTGYAVTGRLSRIYRNDNNGVFTDIDAGLTGVYWSSAAWGDYDNDGWLDILLAGNSNEDIPFSKIYRNTGNEVFLPINVDIVQVIDGTTDWVDFDNDGDLDIIISGRLEGTNTMKIYRNLGGGIFSDSGIRLPGVALGAVSLGDYDFDGDIDILMSGWHVNQPISLVLRNDCQISNIAPTQPTNLTAEQIGNNIIFRWNAATDDHTPALGLSYSLRIGTTAGGIQILSPNEMPDGFSRKPAPGIITSICEWKISLSALTAQGLCYWSVQAIDSSNLSSVSSVESIFSSQLAALFTSDITVGYHPLEVHFLNQSIAGAGHSITDVNWDFGDGSTSTVFNPIHSYTNPGLYNVSLQVYDSANNSSYLIIEDYISVLDANPIIAVTDTLLVYLNSYPAPQAQNRSIWVKNLGHNPLIINTAYLGSSHSGFQLVNTGFPLSVSHGDSIAISVSYVSASPNTMIDFIYVSSNALNSPLIAIRLVAMAIDTPLKAPEGMSIELNGTGVLLSWEPVTETILNTPATPLFYIVYTSPTGGAFGFHGVTESLQYPHNYATLFSNTMLYKVKAYWSPHRSMIGVQALKQGMSEDEVSKVLAKSAL